MALRRVPGAYTPTTQEVQDLASLLPHTKEHWGSARTFITVLKANIRDYLRHIQDERCCYCGGALNETSPDEIDHVAPKSLHGIFVFEPLNLVLACHYCNGFHKKSDTDTIQAPRLNPYTANRFTVVHPIIDDPADHIRVSNFHVSARTQKGQNSIDMFQLHDERQVRARRKMSLSDRFDRLPMSLQRLLDKFFSR
jgi:uncharacterized protein (TIGR02646 family)